MKRITRPAAVAAFACLIAGAALAADQKAQLVRSTDLYTGPGKYPILARLIRGDQVKVLGCNTIHEWCEVGAGKNRGWVSASALELMSKGKRAAK
jgi:uncharacterized protein YraI